MTKDPSQIVAPRRLSGFRPHSDDEDTPSDAAVASIFSVRSDGKVKDAETVVDKGLEPGPALAVTTEEQGNPGPVRVSPPLPQITMDPEPPNTQFTNIVVRHFEDSGVRFEPTIEYFDVPPAYTHT